MLAVAVYSQTTVQGEQLLFRGVKRPGRGIDVQGRLRTPCATDLEHLYRIYSIPTHDKHQWLLLQFIVLLMMDAKGVRNM